MLIDYKLGQTSVVLRVKLRNSSVSTGAGLTGLTFSSSGLIISTICDNESTATAYTVAGSTIETITTLGTFAAPTATKCRFREVDATNHKGIYEIQIADARFATANAKSMTISISGATNLAECDAVVPLRSVNPYSANAFITGVNSLAPPTNWNAVAITAGGIVQADLQTIKTQAVTAAAGVTFPTSIASPTNITAATGVVLSGVTHTGAVIPTVTTTTTATNLTNLPSIPAGWLTATGIAAAALNGKGDWNIGKTGYSLTATTGLGNQTANITGTITTVTNLTNAPTAGDFTATMKTSIGTAVAASAVASVTAGVTLAAVTHTGATIPTVTTVGTTTNLTNLPTAPTDWVSSAAVSAAAVTKIQSGLSTYAGGDTSGTTTLLSRLTTTRAGYLDLLNTGVTLAAAGLDAVPIETGLNARQALAVTAAAIGGTLSGASSIGGTVTIRGAGVSAARIVATGDANGNRTGITLTPPA